MSETLTLFELCSVGGCPHPQKARGWCQTHYRRWQRHGDPGTTKIVDWSHRGEPCSVADCSGSNFGHGYCRTHYKRWRRRGGDPAQKRSTGGNLTALHGSPTGHPCAHCSRRAEDWAYDHGDANEQHDSRGRLYSTDLGHYMPLCRRCHKAFDLGRGGK